MPYKLIVILSLKKKIQKKNQKQKIKKKSGSDSVASETLQFLKNAEEK